MKFFSLLFLVFACFSLSFCQAEMSTPLKISFKNFLGKEELNRVRARLEDLRSEKDRTLILEINSSSGDLSETIEIAKTLYELKTLNHFKIVVYIADQAIGPAAILPFLADELYTSLFISWGDIPAGSEGVIPANLLRNRVRSLINPKDARAKLLTVLADGMTDPSLIIIDHNGLEVSRTTETSYPIISGHDQTLVINQNQLRELGLVNEIIPLKVFEERYFPQNKTEESKEPAKEEYPLIPVTLLQEKFQKYLPFHSDGTNTVGYIFIGDRETEINQSTWLYVKQALDYYKEKKPIFIILELNTPGGEVFAAQNISDALKDMDIQHNIPVVAFINNWAISAGAMIAYSCRFITAVKDASMGAAEPVYAGETGKMETASEKVNSALRTDFANRASFFGRNPLIAEAMVDKDLILVIRNGKVTKLDSENQIRSKGPNQDLLLSPKGKLLTLTSEQLIEFGVADLLLQPEKLPPITAQEKEKGEWPADKMLLFHAPYFSTIPDAVIDAYQMDWKTGFFVFLATPIVSSLLFMGLLVGAYLEFSNPGLSLPGFIAAVCLFLIILSSFSLQIANWLELILLLTGLALLLVELFVLPTFGLLGILGFVLFIAGLFGMLLPELKTVSFDYDSQTLNSAGQYFMKRLAWLCLTFICSLAIIAVLARYVVPNFSGFQRFVLAGHEQDASKGFTAGGDLKHLPQAGESGTVFAPLRPAGKIMVQDGIYDAMSSGGFIEEGELIVITRLEGSTIFVNRLDSGDIV